MTPRDDAAPQGGVAGDAWERGGARVGHELDDAHLVLVIGRDPNDTAHAALGIARAQAHRRRVALGDLIGDAPPIQRLLNEDDPHGFVDSFLYGVSLNRIARHVAGSGELYVLPSGSDAPDYDEILGHPRWHRIAAGFRETGALLVVALPESAEGIARVAPLTDGVILLDDGSSVLGEGVKVLDVVRPVPVDRSPVFLTPPDERLAVGAAAAQTTAAPGRVLRTPNDSPRIAGAPARGRARFSVAARPAALGAVALALAIVALGVWLAARPMARGHAPEIRRRAGIHGGDSVADGPVLGAPPRDSTTTLVVLNSADSSMAAAYAVGLTNFSTKAGAENWLQTFAPRLPAATYAPVAFQGTVWYRGYAGAYSDRRQADSLLAALRANRLASTGDVVRLPFAVLVDSVTGAAATRLVESERQRGVPVYALRAADGSYRLYAGAFADRAQASLFLQYVGTSDFRKSLVYRIGRVQ